MPIYDFMADLGQLQESYKSYDEKQKKSYDDLKESIVKSFKTDYAENRDVNTINENDGVENVPQAKQKNDFSGAMSGIVNLFGSNGEQKSTSNSDGTISLTQEQIDNPYNGYSEGKGSGPNTLDSGGGEGGIGGYAGMIGGIASGMSGLFKKNDEFTNKNYTDKNVVKDEQRDEQIGKVKDTVSTAVGPFGQMFRGIEKLGNSAGDSIGGAGGAMVSSLFSPDETVMSMNSDPDVKTSDKILGSIAPLYGAVVNYNAKRKRKLKEMHEQIDLDVNKTRREQEQRMKDGEESLARLTELRKSQLNYINTNY